MKFCPPPNNVEPNTLKQTNKKAMSRNYLANFCTCQKKKKRKKSREKERTNISYSTPEVRLKSAYSTSEDITSFQAELKRKSMVFGGSTCD